MFLVLLVAAIAPTQTIDPKIVEANVFRPGIVMLVREASIPAGTHVYALKTIPEALDNTLWFDSPDGAEISEVRTSLDLQSVNSIRPATSIRDYAEANAGHQVKLIVEQSGAPRTLAGRLLGLSVDPNNIIPPTITIRLQDGSIEEFPVASVTRLWTDGLAQNVAEKLTRARITVAFRTRSNQPAHIRVRSLEAGAAWNAGYLVDIDSKGKADVTARAQLAVGSLRLDDAVCNLVSGMPDLGQAAELDLSTGFTSLAEWLTGAASQYGERRVEIGAQSTDPYEQLAEMVAASQDRQQIGSPDGLYRGSPPTVGVSRDATFPAASPLSINWPAQNERFAFLSHAIAAERTEDLFTYPIGSVSLRPGERMARVLSHAISPVESHYVLDAGLRSGLGDQVRSVLSIVNRTNAPWPSGSVLVTRANIPLAQVDMPFTAAGESADIPLGAVQDILHTREERELSREPATRVDGARGEAAIYEVTVNLENTRSESVPMIANLTVLGTLLPASGATVTTVSANANPENPSMRATWRFNLAPGEKRVLTARYRRVL